MNLNKKRKGGEGRMLKRNRKGQSTLEYIIILTVLIAALLYVIRNVVFQQDENKGLGKLFRAAANKIDNESAKLSDYVFPDNAP
jgi:hypothetical protein